MSLIDTLNHFIQQLEGDLEGLEWEIREETNYEDNVLDYLSVSYHTLEQQLEDLKQIKSIIEHLEANK